MPIFRSQLPSVHKFPGNSNGHLLIFVCKYKFSPNLMVLVNARLVSGSSLVCIATKYFTTVSVRFCEHIFIIFKYYVLDIFIKD